ncbi:LysM receptor kinase 1b [Medicago truncatula]|uniref:LysM receptor kinase 1b n=1 Tax=Medicago truncatula TaxID=3880 RepID=G7K7M6_MEDTR|nr:LysM receptor kinase 1b [Medicago truncatula]
MEPKSSGLSVFLLCILFINTAESMCNNGCGLALFFQNLKILSSTTKTEILVKISKRVNVPFPCECLSGLFLGHTFQYELQPGDTYASVAEFTFSNLTTLEWMGRVNSYSVTDIPFSAKVNVTINCSCGNREVSKDYGLFITYPLRHADTL